MSRAIQFAIVGLTFAAMVPTSTVSAQESFRERLLTEGPKGWQALRTAVRQLEGSCNAKHSLAKNEPFVNELKFKINGDSFVFEETRKMAGEITRAGAHGVNRKYTFELQKQNSLSDWSLAGTGSPSDRWLLQHPYALTSRRGFIGFLNAPFTIGGIPLPEIIGETGFQLVKVDEVAREGKKLAKVEFTYTPPKVTPELVNGIPVRLDPHMTKMRGGWMLLNPDANWAIEESSLDQEGGGKRVYKIQYLKTERGHMLPSYFVEKTDIPSSWEVEFSDLKVHEIPEKEFTLTAYGLPEPVGVIWPEPTRWWLWLSLAAAASVGVAGLFLMLKRRFQKPQPVEAKGEPKEGPT